ncbi:MAG: hypothetical protein HUU46_20615 [Candidatus Hydrogenedentes bacterium]|nr:hypothetical protein [Candidatus Hydrogenedentota bacterium]
MNLEAIEQRCLAYLRDAPKPLAPIAHLLNVVREDEECGGITESELLGFLRKHELFTVIDPHGSGALGEDELEELAAAGLMTGPVVMLTARIPSKAEVVQAMQQNMGTMLNALEAAMNQARGENNPKLAMEVQAILKRARDLQQKMDDAGLA